jgi:hypothetical protein
MTGDTVGLKSLRPDVVAVSKPFSARALAYAIGKALKADAAS